MNLSNSVIVVLQGWGDTPMRVKAAADFWCDYAKGALVIMTGNSIQGAAEGNMQPYGMEAAFRTYVAPDIPEIWVDDDSFSTLDHPDNIAETLLVRLNGATEAVLVTSSNHAPRAWLTFDKALPGISWYLVTSSPDGSAADERAKIETYGLLRREALTR